MDDRVEAVIGQLQKYLPDCDVSYSLGRKIYRFRINGETIHWFYISRALFHESAPVALINLMNMYQVFETFLKAHSPQYLYLDENGTQKVDENFGNEN